MSFLERFRRPKVARLQAKGDVEGLIQALAYDKDYAVPDEAQQALVAIGSDAVQPLVDLLPDRERSDSVRLRAVRILAEIGDERAQWPVTSLLLEDDWSFREAAAQALATVGDEYSVDSLLRALENRRFFTDEAIEGMKASGDAFLGDMATSALAVQEGNVQIAVVEALEKIGDPKAADTLRSLQQALRVYAEIKAAGPESESLFADSVAKVERRLVEAVDRALAKLG